MKRFGLDFGTTNTVLAVSQAGGAGSDNTVSPIMFEGGDTYRSVLYAEADENNAASRLAFWAGARALQEYTRMGQYGRLMQSLKSYLASPHFTHSNVFGVNFTLEQLIAKFLTLMIEESGEDVGAAEVVVGRPVRFVAQNADAALAVSRLRDACTLAGLPDIRFVEEPVAAAYEYATRVNSERTVLICDLGGGTTDYSLLRVMRPGRLRQEATARLGPSPVLEIMATDGIGMAGDDCDAAIIRHVVAPAFGAESVLANGQHPPRWLFDNLARWHYLSFLRTPQNVRLLEELGLADFHTLVTHNGGMALARAVQECKAALSGAESAVLDFEFETIRISAPVQRADFETWIAPVVGAMQETLQRMLGAAGVAARDVDDVFLTGGTSFIPAVRGMYADMFGAEKLHTGGEFTSVANGLVRVG